MAMQIKVIQEDDIEFKGCSSGILILINQDLDFEKLIKKLIQKLKKEKKFISDMDLFIKGKDRFLDQDELGMIRKMVRDKTKFSILNASQLEPELPDITTSPARNKGLLSSQPFLIINHSLRAGEEINTTSPVILHGDINPGAILKSSGPVIVTGKIKGDVIIQNAGEGAFVYSSGLQPNRLSINSIDLSGSLLIESDMLNASIVYCNQNAINILRLKEDKWEKQL